MLAAHHQSADDTPMGSAERQQATVHDSSTPASDRQLNYDSESHCMEDSSGNSHAVTTDC